MDLFKPDPFKPFGPSDPRLRLDPAPTSVEVIALLSEVETAMQDIAKTRSPSLGFDDVLRLFEIAAARRLARAVEGAAAMNALGPIGEMIRAFKKPGRTKPAKRRRK